MKGGAGWGGGGSSYTLPAKRRWKGLVIGVLGLVILSMLVPLVFLLGLHNGFHSAGYVPEQRSTPSIIKNMDQYDASSNTRNLSKGDQSEHIDEIIKRLGPPTISKDVMESVVKETENRTIGRGGVPISQQNIGSSMLPGPRKPLPNVKNSTDGKIVVDESEKICESKYGSYCFWRQDHREVMKDFMVKKLKDVLFVARAYYPSIAKLPAHDKLSRELKQHIQELEHIFSEAATDADLPSQIGKKLPKMEGAIARAKSLTTDCNNVDKKLRQLVDITEDEANFHMKQSAFLYQIVVQTLPKSLHCLSMRLTVEYFRSPSPDMELLPAEKYMNPVLYHYVILSNNVLAASVVINSTVMHSKESGNLIFHVLTDGHNYFAMKLWFFRSTYKEALVQVLNIEDLNLHYHDKATLHLSLSEEFRVSTQIGTDYISVFSHSHYLLPEIFQNLERVVVLDDDVIVQQDLSALWSLNMEGKVIGAEQYCKVRLGQLKNYLGGDKYDKNSCTWMSGLNVIDLVRWRERDLTGTYRRLLQEKFSMEEGLPRTTALRATLLTFQNQIYALDSRWALSGLGHDYGLDMKSFKSAAALHYNGNMKPWLELGIPKYKNYWKKFLNQEDQFLSECKINK